MTNREIDMMIDSKEPIISVGVMSEKSIAFSLLGEYVEKVSGDDIEPGR